MDMVTVAEAAERLGVSRRRAQHLAAQGELRILARGVIDEISVDRYLATRSGSPRRAWSEATAWGAVALLSGQDAGWMGVSQRSRLRAALRGMSAEDLIGRARTRAIVGRYAGHPSTAGRLRAQLVDTSRSAEALGLAATTAVDGYVAVVDVEALVASHGLIRDDSGRFTLRATTLPLEIVGELTQVSPVLAALDLATSLDIREKSVGLRTLAATLEQCRG